MCVCGLCEYMCVNVYVWGGLCMYVCGMCVWYVWYVFYVSMCVYGVCGVCKSVCTCICVYV